MTAEVAIELLGQTLVLLPERAVYWVETRTLLVADPHWGKAATFRTAGFPVPGGTTAEGLARLDAVLGRTGAGRVIFLGDFLHAREGRVRGTLDALVNWRSSHSSLELLLVRGNHDRHAGDPPPELRITCGDPPWLEDPFALVHHPRPCPGAYGLAGHLHPAARLFGRGAMRARLPCFWFGPELAVLPAFGDFTGLGDVRPAPGDRLFVIAGEEVVEIGNRELGTGNRDS